MPTLRFPLVEALAPDDRAIVERLARRIGRSVPELPDIWRAQSYWPAWMEANHQQVLYGFRLQGALPQLTKEAMHVAVSMVNRCEY